MKAAVRAISFAFILLAVASSPVFSQDDENRQATGLPFKIEPSPAGGPMVVSGKIILEGAEQFRRRPIVTISVMLGGVPFSRANAQESGHFYLRGIPRQSASLIIEVDGTEVSRQNLVAPAMGNMTVDLSVPWEVLRRSAKPGVISTRDSYKRSDAAHGDFDKALDAVRNGSDTEAIRLFDAILAKDSKDHEAWTELGNIYFRNKSKDNAEAAYYKAIELKRDYFLALLNLGKLYYGSQRFDEAILVLSNAVKADPASPDARVFLGESYLAVKKGSLAVPELNAAIKIAPDQYAELHLRLAALFDAAGRKSHAAAEYKLFLSKRPDHPDKAKYQKYISENPVK